MVMSNVHAQADQDGDVVMVPITSTVEQLAGSLRHLRDKDGSELREEQMQDVFVEPDMDSLESSGPLRILAIDTNILIGHLSLLEWVGDLLVAARRLRIGSGYRCGMLIPKIVRAEVDKHKMPRNKCHKVTAMIEPCPADSGSWGSLSIHSPEYRQRKYPASLVAGEAVHISLAQAADYAVGWMTRLYRNTPAGCRILKFQTQDEVADRSLTQAPKKCSELVSPDSQILDCVLYFKRQLESNGGGIILMTNDKALSLEAELEGIRTLRIQPGFSCRSLLEIFDSLLVEQIDKLLPEVVISQMTMFKIYKTRCTPCDTLRRTELASRESVTKPEPQASIHPVSDPEKLICGDETMMTPITAPIPTAGCSTYKPDEDEKMIDIDLLPSFSVVNLDMLMIPFPSPFKDLLDLHWHISQSVAALIRKPLFDHISTFNNLNNVAEVYRLCTSVLDRARVDPLSRGLNNTTQWTASDCLIIINECWVEGCCDLFRECVTPHASSSHANALSFASALSQRGTQSLLLSRWAPSTTNPPLDTFLSQRATPHQARMAELRKVVQVLESRLRPFLRDQLPRDNPMSWSQLLWESLVEGLEDILPFFISVEINDTFSRNCLKDVIQSWLSEARQLCCLRSMAS